MNAAIRKHLPAAAGGKAPDALIEIDRSGAHYHVSDATAFGRSRKRDTQKQLEDLLARSVSGSAVDPTPQVEG